MKNEEKTKRATSTTEAGTALKSIPFAEPMYTKKQTDDAIARGAVNNETLNNINEMLAGKEGVYIEPCAAGIYELIAGPNGVNSNNVYVGMYDIMTNCISQIMSDTSNIPNINNGISQIASDTSYIPHINDGISQIMLDTSNIPNINNGISQIASDTSYIPNINKMLFGEYRSYVSANLYEMIGGAECVTPCVGMDGIYQMLAGRCAAGVNMGENDGIYKLIAGTNGATVPSDGDGIYQMLRTCIEKLDQILAKLPK